MTRFAIQVRPVRTRDLDTVLAYMKAYYAVDGIPFRRARARRRLQHLATHPSLGRILLLIVGKTVVGYAVVIHGFGLEHGLNAMVDELYIQPDARRRGIGKAVVRQVLRACRAQGIESVHADVERGNTAAVAFWRALGFRAYDRLAMVRMTAQ